MRLLVVEDSVRLQKALVTALRRCNYAVDVAGDGEEGLWMANSASYDLIILDIMLPKRDGLSVLGELRAKGNAVHVLLLTARDTVECKVQGLRSGADDYLVKPFALDELLARVGALCRRAYGTKRSEVVVGNLEVDTNARIVRRGGRTIELTAREYQILEYLARRMGQVVSRSEIEEHIYDGAANPISNVVDSAICTLRKKIGVGNGAPLIHTRRGLGYILAEMPASMASA